MQVLFQTLPTDPFHCRTDTVGKIHPHVEVKIVNSEGKTCPVNHPGELLARGYPLKKRNLNNAAVSFLFQVCDHEGLLE
jgi:fatty-acyl-CoA synthase